MTSQEHELQTEREYVAGLYDRLDDERARAAERHAAALRGTGTTLVDREVEVRTAAREVTRLNVADNGLCFGRLDGIDGERRYVGRIGIYDAANEFEPLLLDWRAPAARPFYVATAASPEGMRRRRQFHTRGRTIVDFTDELLGRPSDIGASEATGDVTGASAATGKTTRRGSSTDDALLAAVNAPRGAGMRDIVATIQAEQDEIIRLDHPGVLVIEGGPGTGKTVVALHRVAYLLYTQREQMERNGVLVVGPNPAFLNHIAHVLPSLGETNVVFSTTAGLLPGLHATAEDTPDAARRKGSIEILDVLAAAIADRQRLPEQPIPIDLGGHTLWIDAPVAEWAREEARASGLPHNEARAVFAEIVTYVLTERALGRIAKDLPSLRSPRHGGLTRDDTAEWERLRRELIAGLAENDRFAAMLDALWPVLTPQTLLAELYTSPDTDPVLQRIDGTAWTVSDVPLLDELIDLLGVDPAITRAEAERSERERREQAAYAERVLDSLVKRADHMEGDGIRIFADELLHAEALAEHFEERDHRHVAERAAADRDWTYRHVVVDEAQELSEMDWRVLMRRCPSHSFTIVGDLAQRRSPAGAGSWNEMLDRYVAGRWQHRSLTVNYRTPAEIMAVAATLLAEFAPGVEPPESVRANGVRPWARQLDTTELSGAIDEFVRAEAGKEGTSVVIGPPGLPGTVPPSATKGLEFDAVLVVEPQRILAEGPRGAAELYVALTRATQRLGVLHTGDLPAALAGLTEP